MSDNNPSDVKLDENPNGSVSFATEVVATIAGLAATEVDGVASMVSPSSGFADMFSRKSNRNLTKGVRIDIEDNKVSVDITITVDYGSPIPDVARNIQENVKKAIETMSGLDVKKVDVHVIGISFEREQRANAELDEQHRKMLEKNVETVADREEPAEEATTNDGEAPEEEAQPEETVEAGDVPEEDSEAETPVEFVEAVETGDTVPSEDDAPIDDPYETDEDPDEDDDYEAGAQI